LVGARAAVQAPTMVSDKVRNCKNDTKCNSFLHIYYITVLRIGSAYVSGVLGLGSNLIPLEGTRSGSNTRHLLVICFCS
jgi:hypothetical protein